MTDPDSTAVITDLELQVRRLSDELKKKESIITKLMDVASEQHKKIASLNSTLLDTVIWDPHTSPSPSCSTPRQHNHKRLSPKANYPPLTNRFSVLPPDSPAPATLVFGLDSSTDFPTLQKTAKVAPGSRPSRTTSSKSNMSNKLAKTSTRREFLREAVRRRSGGPVTSAPDQALSQKLCAPSLPTLPVVLQSQQTETNPAVPGGATAPASRGTTCLSARTSGATVSNSHDSICVLGRGRAPAAGIHR